MSSQPQSTSEASERASTGLSWLLLLVLAAIWGSSFILIKKGLGVFSPIQTGSLRIFVAFLCVSPLAFWHWRSASRQEWLFLAVSGFTGSLLPSLLFALAGSRLPSAISGALNALTPIFTMVIGTLLFQSSVSLLKWLGLVIGLIGSAGLIFINKTGQTQWDANFYAWFVVLATLLYAINLNFTKKFLTGMKPLHVSSLSLLIAGPCAGSILFSSGFLETMQTNPNAWEALAYIAVLGIFGTALALILFNKLIQISSAVFASSVTYLIPLVALLWGLSDGEQLFSLHYLGMITIILGVLIINKSK